MLHGATWMLAEGASAAPMAVRDGLVVPGGMGNDFIVDLRDHLVFPGLINAHEHLHVNAVPLLPSGAPFPNSYAWMEAFQEHFRHPAVVAALAIPKALRLRHGALKNLLAGVTCVVHHDPWHPSLDAVDFPVALCRDHGWAYALDWPHFGPPVRESFAATPAETPWMIHLAEGTDDVAAAELERLDQMGCLGSKTVLIHGVGMRPGDIYRVIDKGAAVVWCPSSNLALLGRTLDPHALQAAGRLALGSDSRLSGSRDLLDELQFAGRESDFDAATLLSLVTSVAADILRLPRQGRLRAGAPADMVIVAHGGGDPAESLSGIGRAELRAVVRDGLPRIADPDFADWFEAAGVDAVPVLLDGRPKLMDRALALPELLAMEPGLDPAGGIHA